jgi:RNA polymerase sigma factor (sigma-70 family)
MEVSTLRYSGGMGLHGRSPLLRLQSDERLIALLRRGNNAAFEVLVSRYHSRLLAFCRHLLGSKEDAEDVLQEVLAAAFNAILADERPINVRPWLYRIARNRSLNHLRRIQAIGVDSMDIHYSEHGATTADKVHEREQFRLLVGDIHGLPETQRTALVLREMDAMSYDQIAEAMDTTVPGVKSLLVRARISLAEAAEARQLSCDEVRIELGEVAEGLTKRPTPLVRRHLKGCRRCASFQGQLKQTNKALAALLPIGPMAVLRQLLLAHLTHSAGTSSTAAGAAGATGATGATAGAGATGVAAGPVAAAAGTSTATFGSVGGLISAGAGAVATKAAAGLAAAALVTAGAVEAAHTGSQHRISASSPIAAATGHTYAEQTVAPVAHPRPAAASAHPAHNKAHKTHTKAVAKTAQATKPTVTKPATKKAADPKSTKKHKLATGRTDTQTSGTVLATPSQTASPTTGTGGAAPTSSPQTSSDTGTTGPTGPTGPSAPTPDPSTDPNAGGPVNAPTPSDSGTAADTGTTGPSGFSS